MRKHFRQGIVGILGLAFAMVATAALGQDGRPQTAGNSTFDYSNLPSIGGTPNSDLARRVGALPPADESLKVAENAPSDYAAPSPESGPSNADLAKRVADLERQLAQYAKKADTADVNAAPPANPPSRNYLASNNLNADDSNLAARLADVEKALKKADDKAKAEKEKADGKMTVTPGGRIHIDTAGFTQDAIDKARHDEQNGVEFRTARLALFGGGFNVMKYQIEYDFAGRDKVRCKDTYFAITELPLVQNIQIGHFKEPYSLDELTSDNYITFMERNVASLAMAPARHIGVMAFGNTESQNATYAIGYFAEQNGTDGNLVQADHMGGAGTMRATWLPWYDEATDGRGLIHLGGAYSHRDAFRDLFDVKYRPESHLAFENSLALTDVLTRDELGAEFATVYGPFSFQSEYYVNYIDRSAHVNCKTQGAYAYFSYFLTGESRPYDRARGTFGRVKPFENFFRVRDENGNVSTGKGAWELKYRYSWLDAYDNGALGFQTCGDHTFGVNWYLNPYTRFMAEYIHSGINQNTGLGVGDLNIFQFRAQIDF
jgi:phosphate-selective porin OprO and OprP